MSLYLVSTPIGNLGDISYRAVEILSRVDFIAAEDTRVTAKLLNHLGIKKQLISYYEHNKMESGEKIIVRLLAGEDCALVSDAGTPAISDPGEMLVTECIAAGIQIYAVPGPCAAVTALALSGLPAGRFTFEGFLSTTKKNRFSHLGELREEKRTMIFYEAPHKLRRTLSDLLSCFGDRRIALCREMTKIYEECLRMTLVEAVAYYEEKAPRGEFVLVVEGAGEVDEKDTLTFEETLTLAKGYMQEGMSGKEAARLLSSQTKYGKNELYNAILKKEKMF